MTRYELLDRIGVGGMAEIFRGKAVAAGGFEKPVAIKRILPHLSQDKRFVELLIAEAKVLSLLKHRNIVQIFDVGLGDDGQYFLVMEYVDGKDLGAVQRGLEARRRRMPFDLVLHVGAEICEALEHAHSARAPDGKSMSLVHRDVSPSNVLMSRAGEVKLTDFGIAKRAEQEATGHGAVRGKFAYISPEQARNEHLEPRSDVFSVGILLWELVTNRRLFSGLGDLEALRQVREAQVPRPRDLDGRLAPDVDALIMSALARDPRNRPTAGQLGAKLRTLRYSLEVTVGDPATELAKIIDNAEEVERQSAQKVTPPSQVEFDGSEPTVIRIHTADAFSMRDKDGAVMARARAVIDRFEEEETRQAQLSRDQMAFLRSSEPRDSSELTSTAEPPRPLPGVRPWHPSDERPRRPSDEQTRAREPLVSDTPSPLPDTLDASTQDDPDEATRLVAPANLRTPAPESPAPRRVATQPPPMPGPARPLAVTPGQLPHTPPPGTIHDRSARGRAPSAPPHVHPPPPALSPAPLPPAPLPPSPLPAPPLPPPPLTPLPPSPQSPVLAPSLPPPPALAHVQPGNYPAWSMAAPPQGSAPVFERPVVRRPSTPPVTGRARPRRIGARRMRPLRPWMLVIGAFVMAVLAFAVTRACLHTAAATASKPAVESK